MAVTSMDDIASGLSNSQQFNFFIPSATNAAGGWINLSRAVTTSFGQMAVPASFASGGTLHIDSQVGFPTGQNPTPPALSYLTQMKATFATAGTIHLYDRVWSCSGMSGTVATAQSVVSFPTLTRPGANGEGLEIWIECYTATGATASNITVQYTNSANVSGRNTVSTAHITSMPANRMYQVPLQSGDTGVKSIQSVTLSGTTGAAGSFGVTLMKRITSIASAIPNAGQTMDFAQLGLPIIQNDTAINFIHQGTTTSSGIIMGSFNVIQK